MGENRFSSGWINFWASIGGRRGAWHWFGFVAASTTSAAAYAVLKAVLLALRGGMA